MLRAGLYIRVSTEEQVLHGYSLDAQREALTKYAQEHSYYIVDYYVDEGLSARKSYTKRGEFMRMLNDVKNNRLDLILIIKLDRWFRSVKDYYKVQEILEAHHVDWKTVYENYDTSTASGRLHINIMLSVAQDEADRTSERIKFVFADKLRRKEVIAGTVPRGYKIENKHLVPGDPHDVEMIQAIFSHFLLSGSHYTTANYVRENWNWNPDPSAIKKILQNTVYIGNYHNIENYCKSIIDKKIFNQVQDMFANKRTIKSAPTNRVYIFSRLLKCADCGQAMAGTYQTHRRIEYYYYRCELYSRRRACTHSKRINEKVLENVLLESLESYIDQYLMEYHAKIAAPNPLKNERAKLTKKLEKLKDLYLNDLISMDEYRLDYNRYMEKLNQIQVVDYPKPNIATLEKFQAESFRTAYLQANREQRRSMWRSLIREIFITSDNRIERISFA